MNEQLYLVQSKQPAMNDLLGIQSLVFSCKRRTIFFLL
jgi:hypothetical protein